MGHGDAPTKNRTQHGRADPPSTDDCTVHIPPPTELRAVRSTESKRAEEAYQDWATAAPAERPLAAQRSVFAKILFEVLKAHNVSKNRFADMIGVNEKAVRKMLDGRSPIPMAILGVLPIDMTLDITGRLAVMRGVPRSGMQREIESLRQTRDVRGVHEAQRQLLEVASDLAGAR